MTASLPLPKLAVWRRGSPLIVKAGGEVFVSGGFGYNRQRETPVGESTYK